VFCSITPPRLDGNDDKDQLVLYDRSCESLNKDAIVTFGCLSCDRLPCLIAVSRGQSTDSALTPYAVRTTFCLSIGSHRKALVHLISSSCCVGLHSSLPDA
jgi:hypothetical protein